jgi:hypothetical protein
MPAPPNNPHSTEEVRSSRKRKAPLDDNGDPVDLNVSKRKKLSAITKPTLPKKKAVPNEPALARKRQSVEVQDVPDEHDRNYSEVPRNPRNILEAADGSDDDVHENLSRAETPIDASSNKEDTPMAVEEVEEDEEAELSNLPGLA